MGLEPQSAAPGTVRVQVRACMRLHVSCTNGGVGVRGPWCGGRAGARQPSGLEEEAHVLLGEPCERGRVTADRALKHEALLVLEHEDALLHGVLHDEAHGLHGLVLPDAVRAVDGLHLRRGVPPRVHQEDVGGHRQVERHAACLERDQDHLHLRVRHEGLDSRGARGDGHGAIELHGAHASALEAPVDEVEHRDELGEDDALAHGVALLHERDLLH
mmetsp:Transcript_15486/g.52235  ORF Transcript_15486/g.52235 Transcript_15486/m.52235 type:complete len:216 (-) Transcript_15486:1315-1962(-)